MTKQSKSENQWFKNRGYLHFDTPISEQFAQKIVECPEKVKTHSFYPFLSYTDQKIKVKKVNNRITHTYKDRPIAYAAHLDSHIFSYYAYLLNLDYEEIIKKKYSYLHNSICAFRKLGKNKNNIYFAKVAFNKIRELGNCAVLALDIKGFFDNIDHQILKQSWCKILEVSQLPDDHYIVYKAITKFSKVEKDIVFNYFKIPKNTVGFKEYKRICNPEQFRQFRKDNSDKIIKNNNGTAIPQGSPISALLSNIYMIDFDNNVFNFLYQINPQFMYLRYCDDILCIVDKENLGTVQKFILEEIKKIKLEINEQKTEIVHFTKTNDKLSSDRALQYLGFVLEHNSIRLRSSCFNRYLNKMKCGVYLAKKKMTKQNNIRKIKGLPTRPLYKKKLYSKYSHFGRRNFISYGKEAAEILNSNTIRRQLAPLYSQLHKRISSPDNL